MVDQEKNLEVKSVETIQLSLNSNVTELLLIMLKNARDR